VPGGGRIVPVPPAPAGPGHLPLFPGSTTTLTIVGRRGAVTVITKSLPSDDAHWSRMCQCLVPSRRSRETTFPVDDK
jgi:hypothetical protein